MKELLNKMKIQRYAVHFTVLQFYQLEIFVIVFLHLCFAQANYRPRSFFMYSFIVTSGVQLIFEIVISFSKLCERSVQSVTAQKLPRRCFQRNGLMSTQSQEIMFTYYQTSRSNRSIVVYPALWYMEPEAISGQWQSHFCTLFFRAVIVHFHLNCWKL